MANSEGNRKNPHENSTVINEAIPIKSKIGGSILFTDESEKDEEEPKRRFQMFSSDDQGNVNRNSCCCSTRTGFMIGIAILAILIITYSYAALTTTVCPGEIDVLKLYRKPAV